MASVSFENTTRQLHPADILRPYIDEMKEAGLNIQEHNHGDEFHVFQFYPLSNRGLTGSMHIFSKADGLIQVVYQDTKYPESIFSSDIFPSKDGKYFGFEYHFETCLMQLSRNDDFSFLMKNASPAICRQLEAQNYDTNYDIDKKPSDIYATWQQSRGNRDGVAANGQVIPHLG